MGIEPDDTLSPGALKKVVYAGAHASSFEQASRDLAEEAELSVSVGRVQRATRGVGDERLAQRAEAVERWRCLPLPEQQRSPQAHVPSVACVQVDGGRLQIRARRKEGSARATTRRRQKGYWRESKAACLLRMQSEVCASDPCPELPESFANLAWMAKICREIKGSAPIESAPESEESARETTEKARPKRPRVLTRTVLAMRVPWDTFGDYVAAQAWECGFAAAPRKAFVADGQAVNWSLWERRFSRYTPILDFVHAICYVFQAALAGRPLDEVTPLFRRWAQAVWAGRVADVIAELEIRQQELGQLQVDDSDTHPRRIVATTLRYLRSQASRMRYDEYRRLGLPITSTYIESTIKQINRRVKGSEKFWSQSGGAALLQLSADYLSDRQPLDRFWQDRPNQATGMRCYR